jgi:hypothetical protein
VVVVPTLWGERGLSSFGDRGGARWDCRHSPLALLLPYLIASWAGVAQAASAFEAAGSVEQVYATGVAPGAPVTLRDGQGNTVESKDADELGAVLFRTVTPGNGYRVEVGGQQSEPLSVLTQRSAPPSTAIYDQTIEPHGYQYLTTRDGTKLAIDVHPPQDVLKLLTNKIPSPAAAGGEGGTTPEVPQLPLGELEKILKEVPGVGQGTGGISELLGRVGEGLGVELSGPPRRKLLELRQLTTDLAWVAAECGYFDQSHLDREFRAFAGTSPSGWIAEEFPNIQAGGHRYARDWEA